MFEQKLCCDVHDCEETVIQEIGLPEKWGEVTLMRSTGEHTSQVVKRHLCPNHVETVQGSIGITFPPPPEK